MDICRHDEFCGGCIYQGIPYEEQLKKKEEEVLKLMDQNNVEPEKIYPIKGSPSQYRYRNKMEYTFGDLVKDGEMTLGMHKKGQFMSIVTVDECQLVHQDFNKILRATLDFSSKYTKYHKRTHKGLMRNLIVRAGIRTKEILVNIVTSSDGDFDETGFANMLKELQLEHNIVGLIHTTNDNIADAVKCDHRKIIFGRDYYVEEILGLRFKVSAFSFFQTNVEAVEHLYVKALNLIEDYKDKVVFDLFSGTGTITQVLATKAEKVVGVEIVKEAVEVARENAKDNNLPNCEFIEGDVFETLNNINEKPDVIVVDPPRVGIQNKALDKIMSYDVQEILYISCNPKTLFPNVAYLEEYGYKAKKIIPFDNFPNTKHIETVVLLEKKKVI